MAKLRKWQMLAWVWGKNTYSTLMGPQTSVVTIGTNVEVPQKAVNRFAIWSSYIMTKTVPKVICILHRYMHDRFFYFSLSTFEVSVLVVRISCHGEFWKNGYYTKLVSVVWFHENCYILYWYVNYCFGYWFPLWGYITRLQKIGFENHIFTAYRKSVTVCGRCQHLEELVTS